MPNQSVALRYAEALFQVAEAQGTLDKIDQDLAGLSQLVRENPELGAVWNSPIVATSDKKQVAKELLEGKIDPMTLNTLLLMFDNKRAETLGALQEAFRIRYNAYRKRMKVRVITAMPLEAGEEAELKTQLAKSTEREIEMDTAIDPELIGGIVVTVGDQVIDNSLRGRLEALARTLA